MIFLSVSHAHCDLMNFIMFTFVCSGCTCSGCTCCQFNTLSSWRTLRTLSSWRVLSSAFHWMPSDFSHVMWTPKCSWSQSSCFRKADNSVLWSMGTAWLWEENEGLEGSWNISSCYKVRTTFATPFRLSCLWIMTCSSRRDTSCSPLALRRPQKFSAEKITLS